MERLTFNTSTSRVRREVVSTGRRRDRPHDTPPGGPTTPTSASRLRAGARRLRERYDWDYLWMIAFTALLFFRPQDQIPGLEILHLAELTAIAGLAAMAVRRLNAGQTIAKINTEVIGVIALGAVIVATIPFSTWPGGSTHVFNDIYVKIILIFALMVSTITSPRRVRQMTWLMIVASAYIAGRAVIDYVRGVNLIEGDRVRGSVGGMFQNPNDLALNLVTFLAPTMFVIIQDRRVLRRAAASFFAVIMVAAIVCTKSRSGFLGLIAVCLVVGYYTVRTRPGVLLAAVLAGLMALPAMPQSFWTRMDSILNAEEDPTGSREARLRLINQGLEVFAANPLTGVGAGQFENYNMPGVTIEKWRVTHNVWLQVASELGIFGLLAFGFLVVRAYRASFETLRMLRGPRRKRGVALRGGPASGSRAGPVDPFADTLSADERYTLDTNAKGMLAAMVGWTVCSMFASVAFNWTFYYVFALAVAGREIAVARRASTPERHESTDTVFVRAHA
jgi:O-antigen ligase